MLALVEAIILCIVGSLHGTRYVLTDEELPIKTSRLIGGNRRIPLEIVESVERTLIPFGIRLLGASFHGGYYPISGLGRAFLAITNFNDGLLIKTRHRNCILTPRDPVAFKEVIETKHDRIALHAGTSRDQKKMLLQAFRGISSGLESALVIIC